MVPTVAAVYDRRFLVASGDTTAFPKRIKPAVIAAATNRKSRQLGRMTMKARFTTVVISILMIVGIMQVAWAVQTGAAHKTVWDGVYTDAQASGGQALYTQYCARCHSTNLGGGADQGAPPLKGDKFMENWREDSLD